MLTTFYFFCNLTLSTFLLDERLYIGAKEKIIDVNHFLNNFKLFWMSSLCMYELGYRRCM